MMKVVLGFSCTGDIILDRIIKNIIKGNRRAQSRFYDEYSPLVMGTCMRYLKDADRAADVFQEAFVKIFANIHLVKEAKALPAWIRRITINTALDHIRMIRYNEDIDQEGHELSDQFYGELLDRLSTEVVLDAVNKLPEGYRLIFNLNVIDGYSHKEIGEQLGISESTSRSQLTHARKILKRYLNEIGITRYEQVV